MATTVVNQPPSENSNNGMGFMLGIILLIVFGILFFVYGLPYIQNSMSGGGIQVNVPDKINVDVNQK